MGELVACIMIRLVSDTLQGVRVVLSKYYQYNLPNALLHVFPDIGWNEEELRTGQRMHGLLS